MKEKTFKGFLAWMGTWVAGMAIGDQLLQIESFTWICVWGILIYHICEGIEMWINVPVEKKK